MIFSNIPTIEEDSLDHLRHENADLEEVFENLIVNKRKKMLCIDAINFSLVIYNQI